MVNKAFLKWEGDTEGGRTHTYCGSLALCLEENHAAREWHLLSILQDSVDDCWVGFHGCCHQWGQQWPVPDCWSITDWDTTLSHSLVSNCSEPMDSGVTAITKATLNVYLYICEENQRRIIYTSHGSKCKFCTWKRRSQQLLFNGVRITRHIANATKEQVSFWPVLSSRPISSAPASEMRVPFQSSYPLTSDTNGTFLMEWIYSNTRLRALLSLAIFLPKKAGSICNSWSLPAWILHQKWTLFFVDSMGGGGEAPTITMFATRNNLKVANFTHCNTHSKGQTKTL